MTAVDPGRLALAAAEAAHALDHGWPHTPTSDERRVLVETERGGTIELIAEPDRVVLLIEHGDRFHRITLKPSAASNIGRRLQGHARKALDLRDQEAGTARVRI